MIDSYIRPYIDPPLKILARTFVKFGLKPIHLTLAGGVFGFFCGMMVLLNQPTWAFSFLMLNRLCDGLDGAIARETRLSDFGGYLDITVDFLVYSFIVLCLGLLNTKANGAIAAFVIFTMMGAGTTFLAHSILAAKKGHTSSHQGEKSIYYLSGICEGFETTLFLSLICLFPGQFLILGLLFGSLCLLTVMGRIWQTAKDYS